MSSTSFSAGPLGDRKPELSTTQLEQLVSPLPSASVLGLKPSFGEDTSFDGPTSSGLTLMESENGVSCNRWNNTDVKNRIPVV